MPRLHLRVSRSPSKTIGLPTAGSAAVPSKEYPEASVAHIVRSVVRRGLQPLPSKASISLRVDQDVLEWFKAQGPGYQTRINTVLRAFHDCIVSDWAWHLEMIRFAREDRIHGEHGGCDLVEGCGVCRSLAQRRRADRVHSRSSGGGR
jgi:uncharacterized protein (DUF4415 family)